MSRPTITDASGLVHAPHPSEPCDDGLPARWCVRATRGAVFWVNGESRYALPPDETVTCMTCLVLRDTDYEGPP